MPYFHPYYFENLKQQILKIAGVQNIIPANCRAISLLIENKTKQKISETTLKRVFGFAFSKFQPSLFTLDAMAQFCDYRSWNDFCENQEEQITQAPFIDVANNTLSQNAGKITRFTLQALRNKSGIPYYQTIKRKFIDDHFNQFFAGEYNATILASPSGYGKTIGLCHWIEERLAQRTAKNNDDTILFFSMNALMNVFFTGRDLNEWMLALLGYSPEQDTGAFLDLKQKNTGYFFLVIDGLDNFTFKNDQFHLLLEQITDILSFYKHYPWFKLILTMRTATLINYSYLFEYDQPNWYKGIITHDDGVTNVPLFNMSEVKKLCVKINPNTTHIVDENIVENLSFPLYFQFYYKNQRDNFTLNRTGRLHMYEAIALFILNKIYLGPNSAEKILLLNALWDKMDFKNQTYSINKLDIEPLIKQYKNAYHELLSIGYIREINMSSSLNYTTQIYFGNKDFLAYTVAKKMLDNNQLVFDERLITAIDQLFQTNPIKLLIIKWCLIYALKNGQRPDQGLLSKIHVDENEAMDLASFLDSIKQMHVH